MTRDTEKDWEALGTNEPWFGVLSDPLYLSTNITDDMKEAFYKQGRDEIAWVISQIKFMDSEFSPKKSLDFGSGLGRLAFAMAAEYGEVTGVDISAGMIAEAERQKINRQIANVEFKQAIPPGESFDWINSYIVLQHILPATGYRIISQLLTSLSVGGWVSLQLTFAHDIRGLASLERETHAFRYDGESATVLEFRQTQTGEMAMYDYDLNRVLFMFVRAGVGQIKLVHTDHGGMHGFWIFGKRRH